MLEHVVGMTIMGTFGSKKKSLSGAATFENTHLEWRMLRHIRSKTRSNDESVLLYATEEATKYSGEWVQQAHITG
jgi:hypothetical protein